MGCVQAVSSFDLDLGGSLPPSPWEQQVLPVQGQGGQVMRVGAMPLRAPHGSPRPGGAVRAPQRAACLRSHGHQDGLTVPEKAAWMDCPSKRDKVPAVEFNVVAVADG